MENNGEHKEHNEHTRDMRVASCGIMCLWNLFEHIRTQTNLHGRNLHVVHSASYHTLTGHGALRPPFLQMATGRFNLWCSCLFIVETRRPSAGSIFREGKRGILGGPMPAGTDRAPHERPPPPFAVLPLAILSCTFRKKH